MLFIGAIIAGVTQTVGNALGLASTKRTAEANLDALREQGDIQEEYYYQQLGLLDAQQQAVAEEGERKTKSMIKGLVIVVVVLGTAAIVWRIIKTAIPAAK